MRVPLLFNAYGENLIVTVNKEIIRRPLPFKPYLIAEKPNHHLKSTDIKAIRLPDNVETTMFKMEAETVQINDEKAKQLQMEGKLFCKLPYTEQLFVDLPDYPLQFPNTQPLDVLYLDIEVLTKGNGIFPRPQTSPVIAIGCKHNDNPVQIFDNYTRGNDSQLLLDFLSYYGQINPDVIVTYNGHNFDLPYIVQRMLKYGIDLDQLGRYGKFRYKEGQDSIEFNGRVHLDCIIPARKDQSMCYDDQTEILCETGWKLFKDINESEKVATLNEHTDTLEYQLPIEHTSYNYDNKMYKINNKSVDLLVTKTHDLFIKFPKDKRYNNEEIWEFKKPDELINKKYKVKRSVGNWIGIDKKSFQLPEIHRKKMEFNFKKNNEFKLEIWLEFLGYYISEGSCYINKEFGLYNINIAQSNKTPDNVKKIRACIHNLGFKSNYYFNKINKNGNINFKSKQLVSYLIQFGKAHDKFIPRDLLNLNKNLLDILFKALMLGDGTKDKIKNNYPITTLYSTVSKQLANDVQEIIIKLGFASSIHLDSNTLNNKTFFIYRVMIIKKQTTPTINSRIPTDSWIDYKGKVYCCTVPNQIILVRRNGYPVWCGNSGIKSKGLKSVSAWYGFQALSLGDDVENTQALIGTPQLREYLTSDVNATKVVSDVYLPNAIALAELMQVPLGSIVGCFPSFIPKIICARHCKRLNLIPLDSNKERYGNNREDEDGNSTGEIEPGRIYTLGSRFEGAIVEAHKFGYIKNLYKVDFSSYYPSAIRTWNLGPDTTRITGLKELTGKYSFYRKSKFMILDIPDQNFNKNIEITIDMSKIGFLKEEIEKLSNERTRLKQLLKEAKTKAETDAYDSRQIAIKVVMNSIFGMLGSTFTSYGDMATAIAITGMCRWTTRFTLSLLGESVVGTDTDGMIVDKDVDIDNINKQIAEHIKDNQGVTSYMALDKDEIIDGYFYRMKNYAIRKIKKGKTVIEKHGVAFKSSKQAGVCDTILDTVCQMTLDQSVTDHLLTATKLKNLKQYPLSAFKFRVTFSKDLKGYKNGMSLQRVVGLQVEERLKTKVEDGLQVDYFVTKKAPPCKALQEALKENKGKKDHYYTISQYVDSADQLDERYYLEQIDKLFAIFDWKINPQLELF